MTPFFFLKGTHTHAHTYIQTHITHTRSHTYTRSATRRLILELPSCNAHDLVLAALGCAVLGPSLSPEDVAAFGAAVDQQRWRKTAARYERDKVLEVD
jgi:hypothetical protein